MNIPLKNIMFFMFFLFTSTANAGILNLTPPASLNIDSQNISAGFFTLETFSGFDASLAETVILNAGGADDITHAATIGSGVATTLLNYPGIFPIVQFNYNFDATVPDLTSINANVLSATTDFIISLPFFSATTDFFEIVDFSGATSFHTTAAILDFSASGITNIDLLGDASIFATFGTADVVISPSQFQAHGGIVTVPVPATIWLFCSGLIGLIGVRKKLAKL